MRPIFRNNAALVNRGGRIHLTLLAAAAAALLLPAAASPADDAVVGPSPTVDPLPPTTTTPITVEVKGRKPARVLQKMRIQGVLAEPHPEKKVTIRVRLNGELLFNKKVDPNDFTGKFKAGLRVNACCRYVIVAEQGENVSRPAKFRVKVPDGIGRGAQAVLFHKLLRKQGYHLAGTPKKKNWSTNLAIMAFRKTHGMSRNSKFSKRIFRLLLQRRGAFKPRYTDRGKHVEVDLSRQVMSLIKNGEPSHTFHISSGTSSTPTVRGKYRFYMYQPGYNSKSMYYSIYFHGGYATHGFDPVPTYPASHGCVRNPIPYSVFIYRWVYLGMPIYVYG